MLANLKLRQLRLLVALDSERKLQRAADSLNISQSAASKMLAEIEAVTRMPLFERSARGVEPTSFGAILIRGSKAVLADLDQAADELAYFMSGGSGEVSVGTVTAPCLDLMADVLQDLGRRLDKIKITLHVATSPPLIRGLLSLKYDFALARIPTDFDPRQFDYFEFGDEEACLLVRAEHPLANRDVVDLSEMVDLQWICQPSPSFLRGSVERVFYSRGIALPHRIIDTESFVASLAIAANLDAVVPVPTLLLELLDTHRFRLVKLKETLTIGNYGLVKLKGRRLPPAANVIFDALRRHAKEHA